MEKTKVYGGVDLFRIVAALLVVAIHISPLSNINETADFIFTRVIARVAVPFFFMTTGFFLFSDIKRVDKIKKFLKKTGKIYLSAIILYLPLNIYMGYFKKDFSLLKLFKDILFDGTIYHLWYLPAVMLGVVIVYILLSQLSLHVAFAISCILYVIGLLGDSYYGLSFKVPAIEKIYDFLFFISDYTRNGIFYAPIFLVMGAMLHRKNKVRKLEINILGFFCSISLMIAEGLILRKFHFIRHDSMYFMLIPTMYFLYQCILCLKVISVPKCRTISMIIYLIHPMVIVMVRGVAKFCKLEHIFIHKNMIHYIIVVICSSMIAFGLTLIFSKSKPNIRNSDFKKMCRSWIEINLENLNYNVQVLSNIMPDDCKMMAVVKANAYGHGAVIVSKYLNTIGVKDFAVATIDEAIELRQNRVEGNILILGYTDVTRVKELVQYDLIQTVIDYDYGCRLHEILKNHNKSIEVHIKIDTGMHRLGIDAKDMDKIAKIFKLSNLKVSGIFTHLCVADSLSDDEVCYTKGQIDCFYHVLNLLKEKGITLPKIHIQSSYGLLNYPELKCDYARIGIALYGSLSTEGDMTKVKPDLRPVLSLKSKVAMIKKVRAGEAIGYGRDFQLEKNSLIAILPIGYADGIPRNLSNGLSSVLLNGVRAPIIGRICMDQLLIDITHIPNVKVGDIATIIGEDKEDRILAASIAKNAGTITNEIFSCIGSRIDRVYKAPFQISSIEW